MKERPILFSAPMVRAILDGRKTQTRRLVHRNESGRVKQVGGPKNWHLDDSNAVLACPYGQPGDRLWVRETWAQGVPGCPNGITYRADHQDPAGDGPASPLQWKPSIYMPRAASRITLEITGVRVERLAAITETDAKAEGVTPSIVGQDLDHLAHRAGFQSLWDEINGDRASWESNPWVWVIEFRRLEEVDAQKAA